MSAFVLRGKSNSHIFTIDRGIVARENASDNVNILDQDYAQNLVIIAAEMLRRSRLRCCGVPRCAATR